MKKVFLSIFLLIFLGMVSFISCYGDTDADTDSDIVPGVGSRFVDNGDGTVTDTLNGLMWEKKALGSSTSHDSQGVGNCLHCVDDEYDWKTTMSEWISAVNGRTDDDGNQSGLVGFTDWRIPNHAELQTILDFNEGFCAGGELSELCIDPIFTPISTTAYWSSSTLASDPTNAWFVAFKGASDFYFFKTTIDDFHALAVRSIP